MTLRSCRDKLGRAGLLMLVEASLFLTAESVLAQSNIVPDATLGEESSQVRTDEVQGNPAEVIEGGAQRGANLFHSFSEFNVNEGRGAYFANPTGVENILGRVTGANPSQILGTLGVLGNADLFLINPNGIIFGQNARLDVNGSFIGSTADSLLFPDGEFSARDTQTEPLLTVNVPIGLGLGDNPGAITIRGDGNGTRVNNDLIDTENALRVNSASTLGLVGGNLKLEGATLKTDGGRIELGSVAANERVSLTSIKEGFVLGYEGIKNFNDIQISQTATVDASGLVSGDVRVRGNNITLTDGSQIDASTLGNIPILKTSGMIEIIAQDTIAINGESSQEFVSAIGSLVYPEAEGNASGINITTANLNITNGGGIGASTNGRGNAGLVRITASDTITIDSESSDGFVSGVGSQTGPEAEGDARGITITTANLNLTNGGFVSTGTFGRGNAGLVRITASDTITIDGEDTRGLSSGIGSQVNPGAKGNAGGIIITTRSLNLTNGGDITTNTFGRGNAGLVRITASDTITIDGEDSEDFSSSVSSVVDSKAVGKGGNVTITTDSLSLTNGGEISANTEGKGNAGDVTIDASRLTIQNQGKLAVSGREDFNPGNLTVTADNITLNDRSFIEAITESGNQGNITLNTQLLTLRDNSQITTNATGDATGGNITINAEDGFIVAVPQENSDITANATAASGGRVTINAQSLFGIEAREQQTPLSDITASSDLGVQFGGDVTINTPEVDPESGLNELPTVPIDADAIIAQNFCNLENDRIAGGSSFTIIGKGGLPPTADDPITNQTRIVDWAKPTIEPSTPNRQQPKINSNNTVAEENTQPVIQQARGWAKTKDGTIVLTADAPIIVPQTGEIGYPNCTED